jgi:hypothetical protein
MAQPLSSRTAPATNDMTDMSTPAFIPAAAEVSSLAAPVVDRRLPEGDVRGK